MALFQQPASVEIEWQFAVRDLDAFRRWLVGTELDGWAVTPAAVVHLRDAYFDTSDWRLWRSGYALRVRRTGVAIEATMKARASGRRGVAVRREITSLASRRAGARSRRDEVR